MKHLLSAYLKGEELRATRPKNEVVYYFELEHSMVLRDGEYVGERLSQSLMDYMERPNKLVKL